MNLYLDFEISNLLNKYGSIMIGLNGTIGGRVDDVDTEDYELAGVESNARYAVFQNRRGTGELNISANDFLSGLSDRKSSYINTVIVRDLTLKPIANWDELVKGMKK